MNMNETIFYFFNSFAGQSQWLDQSTVFIAVWFGNIALVGTAFFLIFHRDRGVERRTKASLIQKAKECALVFASAFSAWVTAQILKIVFATERPFDALGIVSLFDHSGYAFPSGHATFFSALAAAVYMYHKGLGVALGITALLIGITRIIAGVHFPIDILGGFILGPLIAVLSYRILRWFGRKYGLL